MVKLQVIFLSVCLFLVSCAPRSDRPVDRIPETGEEPVEPLSNPTPSYANEKYGSDGQLRQMVDVYLPSEGGEPFPTILAFHGGGFKARSKTLYTPYARHFTDQGYAFVSANYRLLPQPYPAQVEDAFCALGWIHANTPEFGFDPDRVFVMGDSAGGYLAAMVGTVDTPGLYQGDCPHEVPTTNPPLGAVILYGFFDLTNLESFDSTSNLETLMGGTVDDLPQERLAEMSPMSWIDGTEPSFLVIHGTQDQEIKSWVSENFVDALEAAGVDATLFLVEEDHAFFLDRSNPNVAASLEEIDEFLAELVNP